jgi:hypothetical protein
MSNFKVIGFNHKRTEDNPRELLFVEQINKEIGFDRHVLSRIVYANGVNKSVIKRLSSYEEQIVLSVIQWLGSPVGKCFTNQVNEKDTHK